MKTLIAGIGALVISGQALAINVTSLSGPTTGQDLANAILGSGVTITSINYIGVDGQAGTFTGGMASGIGIESGILLTSGMAADAEGPNSSDATSVALGTAGSAALDALIGGTTHNANVLEIEFSTTTGNLFFNYAFASEEYNEYVNSSFNDAFGFLLDGTNIAIAPNGDPVAINTVNCGNPYSGSGPNCAYFNNNDPSDGGPYYDLAYDGFTDVFTATAMGLAPGTHTIMLAIADTSDQILDSGVFIEGGSFSGTPPTVPEPATLALIGSGLAGLGFVRKRRG